MRYVRDGLLLLIGGMQVACHSGGDLTADPSANSAPTISVPAVTVATPSANPYYSNANSVTITGQCQSGFLVQVAGAFTTQMTCANSMYSFSASQGVDGSYTFFISQADGKSNSLPSPLSFVWIRKSSVALPSLAQPSVNPFFSGLSSLSLNGSCETGATVSLSGDGAGTAVCANSIFSFNIPKPVDGDYTIGITQTDAAGNTAAISLLWKKYILAVTPTNASVAVGASQDFTITGGSGVYNVVNTGIGGAYNPANNRYTAGTVAGITDTLTVNDTAGASVAVSVNTIAGDADHLVIISGDNQTQNVGTILASSIRVKVQDRYGNGVSGYSVLFKNSVGDASIVGNPIQVTDVSGFAQVNVKLGFKSIANSILVLPLFGPLPDLALTGNTKVVFSATATTTNTGKFGDATPVGNGPNSMVSVDLNSDAKKDVAVINANDPSIGILISRGNGLFNTMTKINAICTGPLALVTGDFNSDSKADLAWLCSGMSQLQVALGIGDGTFTLPLTTTTLSVNETTPSSLAVGDFNNDSKLDVAVGSTSGFMSLRFGNNAGGFAAAIDYDINALAPSVGATIGAIAAGNFDGVTGTDLVALDSINNQYLVCLNDGGGVMSCSSANGTGSSGVGIAISVADFDVAFGPDIAILSNDGVGIFLNDFSAPGSFVLSGSLLVGVDPMSIAAGDFNGDSKADILVANNGENTLLLTLGDGAGGFGAPISMPSLQTPTFVLAQDLNSDGRSDFIISGADWITNAPAVQVLPGRAGTKFGYLADVGLIPKAAAVADFNNDGKLDSAVMNSSANTITILQGDGKGLFTAVGAPLTTLLNPSAIVAADLRNNGKTDLIVTSANTSSVRVLLGSGDGTFASGVDYTVGNGPAAVIASDFNNDGNLDLAVVNQVTNSVSILIGNGMGAFGAKTDFITSSSPSSLVAADLNNDQKLDLMVTCKGDSTISVLIGNGNGTFQAKVGYLDGAGSVGIIAADLNIDGKIDIVTANETDGTVTVLIGNGDGTINIGVAYSTGTAPVSLSSGDLDGDGKLDLVVADGSGLSFTTLKGAAGANYSTTKTYLTNIQTNAATVGDFNNDGALDVLILDATAQQVQTWVGF